MNLEINGFLIIFIFLIILLTIVYPISGYLQYKKLKKNTSKDKNQKLKEYRDIILWSWVPLLIILLSMPLSGIGLNDLGIKSIDLNNSSLNKWIIFPAIGLYGIYLLYNIYSILVLKFNKKVRIGLAKKMPKDYKAFLPITKEEKRTWGFVAISAGITEEIVYRGYLFFSLSVLFPNLSIFIILLISTLIFGIGHIYQGRESIKPTLIGLFFGFFYIVFNSIIPIILLHIFQDLIVKYLIDKK